MTTDILGERFDVAALRQECHANNVGIPSLCVKNANRCARVAIYLNKVLELDPRYLLVKDYDGGFPVFWLQRKDSEHDIEVAYNPDPIGKYAYDIMCEPDLEASFDDPQDVVDFVESLVNPDVTFHLHRLDPPVNPFQRLA